jgi:DnaJ-domain-containing protein 1
MKSQLTDRISVSFYEETYSDKIILTALNKYSSQRFRGNRIKEWAFEFIKSNPELLKELEHDINKSKVKVKEELKTNLKDSQAASLIELTDKEKIKNEIKSKIHIVEG